MFLSRREGCFRFISCYYLGKPEDSDDLLQYQYLYLEEYEKEINDGIMILNYWARNLSHFHRKIFFLERWGATEHSSFPISHRRGFSGDCHCLCSDNPCNAHLSSDQKSGKHLGVHSNLPLPHSNSGKCSGDHQRNGAISISCFNSGPLRVYSLLLQRYSAHFPCVFPRILRPVHGPSLLLPLHRCRCDHCAHETV